MSLHLSSSIMGSLAKGVLAESLWKFCGNFAEICKRCAVIVSGKGVEILRKVCGNFAEISGKLAAMTPSERPHKRIVEHLIN